MGVKAKFRKGGQRAGSVTSMAGIPKDDQIRRTVVSTDVCTFESRLAA